MIHQGYQGSRFIWTLSLYPLDHLLHVCNKSTPSTKQKYRTVHVSETTSSLNGFYHSVQQICMCGGTITTHQISPA